VTVKLCDRDIIVPLRKTLLALVQRGEGRESSNFRWRGRQDAGRDIEAQALTGHGLKQPEAIQFSEKEFAPIPPTLEALRDQVKRTEG